ncbi:MAG: DUF3192 domain-containing protein [Candidatus Omnitrophica bacterium]|nr:DUF3192 domain-containing protein [Candidatus Omnitrophota bacterium]
MKKVLIVLLFLGIMGCNTTSIYQKTASENNANLVKLSVGMTKEDALKVMGSDSKKGNYWIDDCAIVKNPSKSETVDGKDGAFEVIYYFTKAIEDRGRWDKTEPTYAELTPLLFKDGKLAGWGQNFVKDNVPNYELMKFRHLFDE